MIDSRYFSVIHKRIKNKCSCLSHVLYINYFADNPVRSWLKGNENAEHYFFNCTIMMIKLYFFFQSTRNCHLINIKILLDLNDNLTTEENSIIFRRFKLSFKTSKVLLIINVLHKFGRLDDYFIIDK